MTSMRIAMAQVMVLAGDKQGNLHRVHQAIQRAAARGATLICFPETCLLGWVNPWAHYRGCAIPGEETDRLGQWAAEAGVHLCIGLEERDPPFTYDSAVLIDDSGTLLATHRKINLLSELMNPPYQPGNQVRVYETSFGRVGMLICADTFIDDHLCQMKQLNPEWILVPYGWAEREGAWPQHGEKMHAVIRHVARVTGAPVVGTNSVGMIAHGPWSGRVFGGQSLAVDAAGNTLALGCDRDTDLLLFDVP